MQRIDAVAFEIQYFLKADSWVKTGEKYMLWSRQLSTALSHLKYINFK